MMAHTCDLSTQKVEDRGSGVQGQPGLHSEYQTSLGYVVRLAKNKTKGHLVDDLLFLSSTPSCFPIVCCICKIPKNKCKILTML
jgi:hypothetical protein